MMIDYLDRFPIPGALLPTRLRGLLEPAPENSNLRVEIATRHDIDQYGPRREYVHMIMVLAPKPKPDLSQLKTAATDGVVSYSTPHIENEGGLAVFDPSVSGHEYIVAASGNGSFYSYNLSEKVWMALGLSPRCLGGEEQKVIYDDLSLPKFAVAEGEISTEYYYSSKRNVRWVMSNEYLRRYLWMRGAYGVRVFYYETLLPDGPELRTLMSGDSHVRLDEWNDWYTLDIREHKGRLLIQVWAAVVAVPAEPCPEPSADGVTWPGVSAPMNRGRANGLTRTMPVYLDDQFLERYEQSNLYRTVPINVDGSWLCSPSYGGQWSFTGCRRVGRNMISVPMRDLYQPKPAQEILHAHAHALDPSLVALVDHDEEHIVSKTHRLVNALLEFGDNVELLSDVVGERKNPEEVVGFSRLELKANGWLNYPELCRLAQVAPISMTEQAFLSRCKSLHELWQRIPNRTIRAIILHAVDSTSEVPKWGSVKLLQALSNIAERLNAEGESLDGLGRSVAQEEMAARNDAFAALFVNYELRNADAHDTGDVLRHLTDLGFDGAALNEGYGRALDHVFDGVISAFSHLNAQLHKLMPR